MKLNFCQQIRAVFGSKKFNKKAAIAAKQFPKQTQLQKRQPRVNFALSAKSAKKNLQEKKEPPEEVEEEDPTRNKNQSYLRKRYINDVVEYMSHKLITSQKQLPPESGQRYIVGISGVPGSGKTTCVNMVNERVNQISPGMSAVVPMDGFHIPKKVLLEMKDPDYAVLRRGAHWTFDGEGFVQLVKMIRYCWDQEFDVPGFDHGVGDPTAGTLTVTPQNKIILVEGNYVLLDMPPWDQLKQYYNETWFIECQIEVAMDRVFFRHTSKGESSERAQTRIDKNDRLNAEQIEESKKFADFVIPSVPVKNTNGTH